jgi:hypothetical protein
MLAIRFSFALDIFLLLGRTFPYPYWEGCKGETCALVLTATALSERKSKGRNLRDAGFEPATSCV